MTRSQKAGTLWGTIGATIGGFSWIVITGIGIKSPVTVFLALISGLACIMTVVKLNNIRPERGFAIGGSALLWIVVVNFIFLSLADIFSYSLIKSQDTRHMSQVQSS